MIPVSEAIAIVREKAGPLEVERVALAEAAGRVLAEDVFADCDLPPFDRAQMDGYAVRSEDLREVPARLRVVGEAAAGRGWRGVIRKGEAVRIMTGAPLPAGAGGGQQGEPTREIEEAAARADVLVLSGGVSMGRYDFTKDALRALDAEIFFERVALRPGKPTVFARLPVGRRTLVFGLPGNPVSVSVTFNLFARTALRAMQGATEPALVEATAVLARAAEGGAERTS